MFNNLKADTAYPWLATDFAWNADGTPITFTLRDGVKFSDGTPLTADDVAYTFQVMKDARDQPLRSADRQAPRCRQQQGHGHVHVAAVPEHVQHRRPDLHRAKKAA